MQVSHLKKTSAQMFKPSIGYLNLTTGGGKGQTEAVLPGNGSVLFNQSNEL